MCQEEDSPALKIASILEDYIKKNKERQITTTRKNTNNTMSNRTRKKNNCMDISSDKLTKSHTRIPGHGYEREIVEEKPNIF